MEFVESVEFIVESGEPATIRAFIPPDEHILSPHEEIVAFIMRLLYDVVSEGHNIRDPNTQKGIRHRCYQFIVGRKRLSLDDDTKEYVRRVVPFLVQFVFRL